MAVVDRLARSADALQRRHAWLAFPVAVGRKFMDDRAHNLAALVAYFSFVSIFPLLLVLVTVLDIVLRGDAALRHRLVTSALGGFPVIGAHLADAQPLRTTGIALAVGLIGALLGGSGVAAAAQNALNAAWLVPFVARPRFPRSQLRNVGFVVAVGLGQIVTSTLAGTAGGAGHVLTDPGARAGAAAIALVVNFAVFWAGFRLVTPRMIASRQLWLGALAAALAWEILQLLAGFFIANTLAGDSSPYAAFGLVLGFLAWFYVQAQVTLVAIEIDVVRAYALWPRSLHPPPFTPQDLAAHHRYTKTQQRHRSLPIDPPTPNPTPHQEEAP